MSGILSAMRGVIVERRELATRSWSRALRRGRRRHVHAGLRDPFNPEGGPNMGGSLLGDRSRASAQRQTAALRQRRFRPLWWTPLASRRRRWSNILDGWGGRSIPIALAARGSKKRTRRKIEAPPQVVRGLPPLPGCGTACSCVNCCATNGFFGTQNSLTLVPHRTLGGSVDLHSAHAGVRVRGGAPDRTASLVERCGAGHAVRQRRETGNWNTLEHANAVWLQTVSRKHKVWLMDADNGLPTRICPTRSTSKERKHR